MPFQVTGEATTSTLRIQFSSDSGGNYLVAADSDPTLTVSFGGSVVTTISSPTNPSTGIYEGTWTPASAGEYSLSWSFTVDGTSYSSTDTVFALDPDTVTGSVTGAPDVGSANTCVVSGTFLTAGGDYLEGVYVRFSPNHAAARNTAVGFVAQAVTTVSGANGIATLSIVRGIEGLLSISGTSLVRRVTIPDAASANLFELAAQGDDLLEVQELELTALPRRT
jgi:hypothetical protein